MNFKTNYFRYRSDCALALFKVQKKCDWEIRTFLHIFAHLFFFKRAMVIAFFMHFWKVQKSAILKFAVFCTFSLIRSFLKSDCTIMLLKRQQKVRSHNRTLWKSKKKCDPIALLKRAKMCNVQCVIAQPCMCVCACLCEFVRGYVHTCVHTFVRMCMHTYVRPCKRIHSFVRACVQMCVHTYVCRGYRQFARIFFYI